jgi:Integrase core domain
MAAAIRKLMIGIATDNPIWDIAACRELLDRLLIVNEHHLRQVLTGYLQHYNTGTPHRALGQLTPAQAGACPPEPINLADHCAAMESRSPPESYFRATDISGQAVWMRTVAVVCVLPRLTSEDIVESACTGKVAARTGRVCWCLSNR